MIIAILFKVSACHSFISTRLNILQNIQRHFCQQWYGASLQRLEGGDLLKRGNEKGQVNGWEQVENFRASQRAKPRGQTKL